MPETLYSCILFTGQWSVVVVAARGSSGLYRLMDRLYCSYHPPVVEICDWDPGKLSSSSLTVDWDL